MWLSRVTALAAVILLAGCTTPTSNPAATGAPAGEGAAVQPKVNRLVLAVPPPPTEYNDLRHLSVPTLWPVRPMYEYLVGLDPVKGTNIPQLATAWNIESDGKSMRFQLRPGVAFHKNHGEVGPQDVIQWWKEAIREDSLTQTAAYFREVLKDVEVVNDREVVLRMTRPDANLLRAIGEVEGSGTTIRSKAHFDEVGGQVSMQTGLLAGTGPYQFVAREVGQFVRFERVPYQHWRVTPDFPEFEFRFVKEPSTRLAGLLAGEMHVTSLPEDLTGQAEARGNKVIRGKVPALRAFLHYQCCWPKDPRDPSKGWVNADSPLLDVRVRKAFDKAINRDELNKVFFGGKGERLVLNHFQPSDLGWNPDWEKRYPDEYGYDPAKARALLSEAGYGPGKQLTTVMQVLPYPLFSGAEDIAESVAGYLRTVGVNVTLLSIDTAQQDTLRRQYKLDNHLKVHGTSSAQLLGVTAHNASFQSQGTGMSDANVNNWVEQIWGTLDEKKQAELWRKVGDYMYDQHMTIPLFWLPTEALVNPTIVADYVWPGAISGTWSHVENIKAAR